MTETVTTDIARNRRWTTVVAAVAAMVLTLDITVVNIALPRIGHDLHATLDGLQWVINAYTLAFAALLLTAGALSDRLGRRRIFLLGSVVFTLASAVCAAAWTAEVLIAARAIQGVGAAMMMGTALALIANAYDGAESGRRERAIAMFAAAGALAATSGPIVGGLIVDSMNWRIMFAINIPLGVFILYGALRKVDADHGEGDSPIDVTGGVLAVLFLFSLNYGLVTGADKGWDRTDVVATLAGGGVLLLVFIAVMARLGDRAMLPLRLFAIPSFSGAMLLSLVSRMVSFGLFPFLIIYLSASLGFSPIRVGLVLTLLAVALMAGAPAGLALAKRVPLATVLALGMVLTGIGMFTAVPVGPGDGWTALLPMLLLAGFGSGLLMPHMLGIAVAVVPPAQAGTASGAANSFLPLGTSVSVAVFGAIFTAKVDSVLTASALGDAGVPEAASGPLRSLVTAGQLDPVTQLAPQSAGAVRDLAAIAYTDALSVIFLTSGIAAVACGLASLVLIRTRDNLDTNPSETEQGSATD